MMQLPQELKDLILSKKCVAFIGSGISSRSYDSWPELISTLCERCGSTHQVSRDSPTTAFLDAAQDAKNRNEDAYYEYLGEHFGRPADLASLTYDALLSLPFDCYLTVNFDPLLALKSRTASLPCHRDVYAYPSLDRKLMGGRSIHYLHGMIKEHRTPARGTIVLARDEFDEAYDHNSALMNLLIPTLDNEPLCFIGCGLREPVMPRVFDICKELQRKRMQALLEMGDPNITPPQRFIVLPRPHFKTEQGNFDPVRSEEEKEKAERYYRDMNIVPVWYRAQGANHAALRYAFEQLADLRDITPKYGWDGG